MQEYYLARRKSIWYGGFRLADKDMKDVDEYFTQQRLKDVPALNIWRAQKTLRHPKQYVTKLGTLFELLNLFDGLKCADGRDKIFALLSLLTTEAREAISIEPDYSRYTFTLFLDVATTLTNMLKRTQSLQLHLGVAIAFYRVANMLLPDLQNQLVQTAILDLRALINFYKTLHPNNSAEVDHNCHRKSETPAAIDDKGCRRCRKKPFVTLGFDGTNQNWGTGPRFFSKTQWQEYVKALLASENGENRQLGAKYYCDQIFQLYIDGRWLRKWLS